MLHLQVVLVLTMVRSRPHHLRHQWSQINTFVFLNHIHHHTYFKGSYVHIQVFHILHHHTMKLLQAFESFLPEGLLQKSAVKTDSLQAVLRQRKLFRCQCNNFGSECYFGAANTFLTMNANSLQTTQFRQLVTISLQTTQPRQRTLICCRQYNFGSER